MPMRLNIGQHEIVRFKQAADSAIRRARATVARADQAVATVITTSEVAAASFLFGLAQGKWGGIALVGVPIDLLSGVGLHILGFAGIGGVNAHHLHAFGDGALASYMNGLGRSVGRSIQTPEDKARIAKAGVSGEIGGLSGGASLADEELARMARAARP